MGGEFDGMGGLNQSIFQSKLARYLASNLALNSTDSFRFRPLKQEPVELDFNCFLRGENRTLQSILNLGYIVWH